jgi:coproporphyrinogen III oxidase-like Fe-S oxidoreductase
MTDDPQDRATWPFPALMPFRIYDYPVPAVMPAVPAPDASGWPQPMAPSVAAFARETAQLTGQNQIYVHVPFCPFRCSFCAFYKDTNKSLVETYMEAVLREIERYGQLAEIADRGYSSIYFGGGTPTELAPDQVGRIIQALRDNLRLAPDLEVSLEGIADDMVRPEYLARCREHGVTRMAFGVQSLDPVVRKAIGRGPDSMESYPKAVAIANELGMPANVEMIMGCPEQTEESLERDLREVIGWQPGSVDISSYIMVPGTNLFKGILRGSRTQPGYGARLVRMRQLAFDLFREAGYRAARAEVFVRRDTHRFSPSSPEMLGNSLHTHLAFGPSAIGHLDGTAFRNLPDLGQYAAAVHEGRFPLGRAERLTGVTAARRALLFAIGAFHVPEALIRTARQRRHFERWEAKGLVRRGTGAYDLTERGMRWENQLQIAVLGLSDFVKAARMFGSYEEQEKLVTVGGELGQEFMAQVAGGSRVKGAAYRASLKVMNHLPFVDKRPIGLMGTLESNENPAS